MTYPPCVFASCGVPLSLIFARSSLLSPGRKRILRHRHRSLEESLSYPANAPTRESEKQVCWRRVFILFPIRAIRSCELYYCRLPMHRGMDILACCCSYKIQGQGRLRFERARFRRNTDLSAPRDAFITCFPFKKCSNGLSQKRWKRATDVSHRSQVGDRPIRRTGCVRYATLGRVRHARSVTMFGRLLR